MALKFGRSLYRMQQPDLTKLWLQPVDGLITNHSYTGLYNVLRQLAYPWLWCVHFKMQFWVYYNCVALYAFQCLINLGSEFKFTVILHGYIMQYSIVEGQVIKIGLDDPYRCQAETKQYKYFMLVSWRWNDHVVYRALISYSFYLHTQLLPSQRLPSQLCVEVKSIRGDPDLFLSQSCSTPSQSRYTWCNQDIGNSEFQLSVDDKEFNVEKVTLTFSHAFNNTNVTVGVSQIF